jgi:hypothetical protein
VVSSANGSYEIKREDPDDVYIDVLRREEQRKGQGLPPRIGIIPYSAVADEETRVEEETSACNRAAKHSKPTPKVGVTLPCAQRGTSPYPGKVAIT